MLEKGCFDGLFCPVCLWLVFRWGAGRQQPPPPPWIVGRSRWMWQLLRWDGEEGDNFASLALPSLSGLRLVHGEASEAAPPGAPGSFLLPFLRSSSGCLEVSVSGPGRLKNGAWHKSPFGPTRALWSVSHLWPSQMFWVNYRSCPYWYQAWGLLCTTRGGFRGLAHSLPHQRICTVALWPRVQNLVILFFS